MRWSPSLIATGIWIVISSLLGLLEFLLKYHWKDARTQKHRIARKWLFSLFILSSITTLALTMHDKSRAEKESKRLAQALKEAADERKVHTMAGHMENQKGMGQVFMIGDMGFFLENSSSLFDGLGISIFSPKIAEQNSIIVSNTFDGTLSVSAKIRSRDGLVAEISNNEWKVSPSPRTWDRNYSSNALEVQNADGEIVFQVRIEKGFDSSVVAHFQGIFFDSDGQGIAFVAAPTGGAYITFITTNSTSRIPQIKPLFKYPSELHLGEFADQR